MACSVALWFPLSLAPTASDAVEAAVVDVELLSLFCADEDSLESEGAFEGLAVERRFFSIDMRDSTAAAFMEPRRLSGLLGLSASLLESTAGALLV